MFGFHLLGRVALPHCKYTENMPAIPVEPPKTVLLPLSQHIGAPATPLVKVGDQVEVGTKIAEASSYVSSPIFSSVSGKVTKIEEYLRSDGKTVPAIRIESDGEMKVSETLCKPEIHSLDDLVKCVWDSGLVGLGGAGFPTHVKLDALKKEIIDTVIINAAECEPYITADTRTIMDDAVHIEKGIRLLEQYAPSVKSYIIGIEKNKPCCIEKMQNVFKTDDQVKVIPLPDKYPQGSEKILIYNTTGKIVMEGALPSDEGILVMNVSTLAFLASYVETGMPLVKRIVTIDGSALAAPKNVEAPIGTSIGELIEAAGGTKEPIGKVLFGGPMMGIAASSLEEPTVKTTGALTVLNVKDARMKEESACIHCGRCVEACPHHLNPVAFSKALTMEDEDSKIVFLKEHSIMICTECGSCSYVCPANRPLVQNNRLCKGEVRGYDAHKATLKK